MTHRRDFLVPDFDLTLFAALAPLLSKLRKLLSRKLAIFTAKKAALVLSICLLLIPSFLRKSKMACGRQKNQNYLHPSLPQISTPATSQTPKKMPCVHALKNTFILIRPLFLISKNLLLKAFSLLTCLTGKGLRQQIPAILRSIFLKKLAIF